MAICSRPLEVRHALDILIVFVGHINTLSVLAETTEAKQHIRLLK